MRASNSISCGTLTGGPSIFCSNGTMATAVGEFAWRSTVISVRSKATVRQAVRVISGASLCSISARRR